METHVRYLARSPIFETEKAFSTDYPVDHVEGARRTNHEVDDRPVTVSAIEDPSYWKLDVHGFCILHAETHLDPYKKKREVQDAYWYEIEAILHKHFPQYSRIEGFDLTLRKRGPEFPAISRGYRDEFEQPASMAHSDYSQGGGFLTLQYCFPGQDDYWKDRDFDMLKCVTIFLTGVHKRERKEPDQRANDDVWRPLTGPTDDWPLALCDYTTIDIEEDIRLNDAIRRDLVGEGSLLHYNKAHRWYYFKDQGVNDLLVFRNSDPHGKRARE
ncbi:hypothetical protein GP486_005535 [Trichoglossum hirsutum]|uniref:Uncharacterized protein n=1 Tax=Trichoglossum hirsutum TaxID=265104 RepID=A0A9P8L993_9PEZI|nr:hypothetical protein GP486_005535 [Trichoglossum hirsutum]